MLKYRDLEKEKLMLSLLLKSKRIDKTKTINQLDYTSFSTLAGQEMFKLIRDYNSRYMAPLNREIALSLADDLPVIVKNKVKGLIKGVSKLKPPAKTVDYLVEELLHFEACRDVQRILISAKDIFKQHRNPFMVTEYLMDMITQSQMRQQGEVEILDVRADFKERLRFIRKMKESGIQHRGITSGIDERFDDEVSGYCPGDLHIFVAQPAGGKSLCMQDQATYQAVELGKRVAIVTNEMTPRQVAFRIDARIAEIRHRKFKKPALMRNIDIEKWKISIKDLKKNRLKILGMTGGNCSAAAINGKLKEVGFEPELLYVDYINNMVPNGLTGRDQTSSLDWQPQGMILRETKNLALSRKIPVITAGQLKPEAHDKDEITPNDIAINKQALMQNADGLYAIVQTKGMKMLNPPRARIQFMKIREGKTREFIEIIPDFGIIRIHNPKKKKAKKKKRKDR